MWSSGAPARLGFALDARYCSRASELAASQVDEQQRELLIGPAVDADMDVRRPTGIGRAVQALAPQGFTIGVIEVRNGAGGHPACSCQR